MGEQQGPVVVVRVENTEAERQDRLVTVAEAAGILGVSRWWVYRHGPKIPGYRKLGGHVRFGLFALQAWIGG